jgi:hypothetical protein
MTSFVQSDFRAGKWSPNAQGKMHDQRYKAAMAVCNNGMPLYNGPWTRRPGFLWGGNTRQGRPARIIDCYLQASEPFQLELTDGVLRAHVGNGFVFAPDANVTVESISTAKPAVVAVNGTIPAGWNNYDTITLEMVGPSTSPILAGRQYQIQSISGNTFAIYDSITGLPIDGSIQAYTAPTFGVDRIYKILELPTPWAETVIQQVRMVQTDTVALMMQSSFQPQSLIVPPYGNFAIAPQAFLDGPYFNINTTSTTATPNALSGSVIFTFNSTVGINNNYGFQNTDVGRAFRFQSGPPAWAGGTEYANGAVVTGSDNNVYQSVVGNNTGNDPTTDDGTHWVLTGTTIIWVWGYITAVNSDVSITVAIQPAAIPNRSGAQIPGDVLISASASTSWQLGLYSSTNGWPSVGTYYEGRLLLAGQVITNRFDGSCADAPFNFAPSAPDGTVGDGNALAEYSNAPKINQILWMKPTSQGVLCGSSNGEWNITASSFGDPLTPTSVQFHRVSTYGCANIEPEQTELTTTFVQREQQRVLNYANYPYGEAAGWFADNLSENADDLCAPGVAEIRFQQEPSHFLWARCKDGSLISTTFEHAAYGKESYNGWHNHNIGGGRTVTSISCGPSSDGLSTTLYVVAFNLTSGFYEYLELGHIFDASQPTWAQNFTDGVASPELAQDIGTGIEIFGLYEIIGQTVTLNMGGLDLGDFVVQGPDGHITVPFTSTFTRAYYQSFGNLTEGNVLSLSIYPPDANVYNQSGVGAYVGPTTNFSGNGADLGIVLPDQEYFIALTTNGLRLFNLRTLAEISDASMNQMFYGDADWFTGSNVFCYHPNTNCIYGSVGTGGNPSNSMPIAGVDMKTLKTVGSFGTVTTQLPRTDGLGFTQVTNSIIPLAVGPANYIVAVCLTNSGSSNTLALLEVDNFSYGAQATVSDAELWLVDTKNIGQNLFYGVGTAKYGSPATTPFHVYKFAIGQQWEPTTGVPAVVPAIVSTTIATITPANVDATWTNFSAVTGPAFDPTDGNLLVFVSTTDSVTTKNYWLKINATTGAIVLQLGTSITCPFTAFNMANLRLDGGQLLYATNNTIWTLSTPGQSLASASFPGITDVFTNQMYWPTRQAIIASVETAYNPGAVVPLGAYSIANPGGFTGWGLLTALAPAVSADWPPPDQFNAPLSIGVNYTSTGQLLRPDFGQDAGAAAGPAFGKKRRQHWFACAVVNAQNFNISTDITFSATNTDTVQVMDEEENLIEQPTLYTGTLSTTMPDGYSWDSQIAWQITRPLPLTITAMSGFIDTMDK